MDPPLQSGVKLAVSWVDNSRWKPSEGKVLASVFWDEQVILLIDYLNKWRIINSEYYIALLVHLKGEKSLKNGHKCKRKKVLFRQDNEPYHKSIAMIAKLHELHFELLPPPPYSPDLVPSDYWLFTNLKKMFQGKRFGSNEEVILETEAKNKSFYKKKKKKKDRIVREVLESVYHPRRRLCWWIKSNFA